MPKQHNFRLDARTAELLAALEEHTALSKTDVVRQAIREKAARDLPGRPRKINPGKTSQDT